MGNALLSFDYDVAARNMAAVCGATPEVCRELSFGPKFLNDFETGRITPAQFHARFSESTRTTSDLAALSQARCDMFQLIPETARILTQLKAVRKRTGLLSNTSSDHIAHCRENFTTLRLFDVYVLSCEVGAMKPDRKIFEVAIDRAGVSPERIFYVDDRQENITAARGLGIDAVLFQGGPHLIDALTRRGVNVNL
jgi:putative hydrolase of the HAD superfamily